MTLLVLAENGILFVVGEDLLKSANTAISPRGPESLSFLAHKLEIYQPLFAVINICKMVEILSKCSLTQ